MSGTKIIKDDLAKVLSGIRKMPKRRVLIGIPEDENARNDGPDTNAAIAYQNERGVPAQNIPARPFLVPGVADAMPKAIKALKRYAADGLTDHSAFDKGLNAAGLVAQSAVKNRIRKSIGFAPLSERTLAERRDRGFKGEKPLVRTGQLLNSITYVVRDE